MEAEVEAIGVEAEAVDEIAASTSLVTTLQCEKFSKFEWLSTNGLFALLTETAKQSRQVPTNLPRACLATAVKMFF